MLAWPPSASTSCRLKAWSWSTARWAPRPFFATSRWTTLGRIARTASRATWRRRRNWFRPSFSRPPGRRLTTIRRWLRKSIDPRGPNPFRRWWTLWRAWPTPKCFCSWRCPASIWSCRWTSSCSCWSSCNCPSCRRRKWRQRQQPLRRHRRRQRCRHLGLATTVNVSIGLIYYGVS